jgi:hypothetical protein
MGEFGKKKKTAESLKEEDLSINSGKKQDFISKITSAKRAGGEAPEVESCLAILKP